MRDAEKYFVLLHLLWCAVAVDRETRRVPLLWRPDVLRREVKRDEHKAGEEVKCELLRWDEKEVQRYVVFPSRTCAESFRPCGSRRYSDGSPNNRSGRW